MEKTRTSTESMAATTTTAKPKVGVAYSTTEYQLYKKDPAGWREALRNKLEVEIPRPQRVAPNSGKRQSGVFLMTFFVIGVLVSVVDITFLQDVLGRILNISSDLATVISFVVGLAAIGTMMGFYGYKKYYSESESKNWFIRNLDVILWVILGFALAILRIISGSIIEVGDESTIKLFGLTVRSADLVIAPIMMVFYFAAGTLSMYCIQHFFESDQWYDMQDTARTRKIQRTIAMREAELKRTQQGIVRSGVIEERQSNRSLATAERRYQSVLRRVHREHEQISAALSELDAAASDIIHNDDNKETLLSNVDEARSEIQGQVAMIVNSQSNVSVETLNGLIDDYNKRRPF